SRNTGCCSYKNCCRIGWVDHNAADRPAPETSGYDGAAARDREREAWVYRPCKVGCGVCIIYAVEASSKEAIKRIVWLAGSDIKNRRIRGRKCKSSNSQRLGSVKNRCPVVPPLVERHTPPCAVPR